LFLAFFFFLFQHAPVWWTPIFTARLIDLIMKESHDRMFWFAVYGGTMVLLVLGNIPACILTTRYMSRLTRGVSSDLRIAIAGQLQQLTLHYHDRQSIGRMQSKAIRDIDVIENLPRQLLWLIYSTSVSILIAIVVTAIRKPSALLIFAILLPLGFGLRQFFMGKMKTRAHNYRTSFESMSVEMTDMMTMIAVTRAHGLEEFELERVKGKILDVYQKGYLFDMLNAVFGSAGWVAFTLPQTLFLLSAVYMCFKGEISVGDVVMFNAFFASISQSLLSFIGLLPVLAQAKESARSVTEILSAPDLEENRGKREVAAVNGNVVFDGVNYVYPETQNAAIRNFSLNVPAGTSVAFVGPSGCGKSTLLSLILGFIRPASGKILLDGVDMQELDLRTYRTAVGVVSQDIVFFSGSVLENVQYGMTDIPEERIVEALKLANAWEFVEKLPEKIHTRLGEQGTKLSGGQKQRLAIARALIRNPKILILDEATSALDIESEILVKDALEHVMKNRTTFVVAHRLSTVRNCDCIVIMEAGSIVEKGTHTELLQTRNFYSRIVEAMG
jgi:ATP-binding cassette subfamily B protein